MDRFAIIPHTPGIVAIVDRHAGGELTAYAPFKHAEQVRLALEVLGQARAGLSGRSVNSGAKATFSQIAELVRAAFIEGTMFQCTESEAVHEWAGSDAIVKLHRLMLPTDEMPVHPLEADHG